jgi:hypothetical protein
MALSASCGHRTSEQLHILHESREEKDYQGKLKVGRKERKHTEKSSVHEACAMCVSAEHTPVAHKSPAINCPLYTLLEVALRDHMDPGHVSLFFKRQQILFGPLVGLQSSFHVPLVNSSCLVNYLSVSCSGLKKFAFSSIHSQLEIREQQTLRDK